MILEMSAKIFSRDYHYLFEVFLPQMLQCIGAGCFPKPSVGHCTVASVLQWVC